MIEWSDKVLATAHDFEPFTNCPNAALAAAIKALCRTGKHRAWHYRLLPSIGGQGTNGYRKIVLNGKRG